MSVLVRFTSHLLVDERFVHRRIRIMRMAGCRLGEWLYLPICRDSGRGHHRLGEKQRKYAVVEGNGEKPLGKGGKNVKVVEEKEGKKASTTR